MECQNPELKLEGLRKAQPELYKTKEQLILYSDDEGNRFIELEEKSDKSFEYLEGQRVKSGEKSEDPTESLCCNICSCPQRDMVEYHAHTNEWYYNSAV